MEVKSSSKGEQKRCLDLQGCWLKDEELSDYFRLNCQEGHEICLAVRLMKEAVVRRKSQLGQTMLQSNVMSPIKPKSKEVTAKVTQIQPVQPEKIRIFGKPRVKLDNGQFCVVHEDNSCQNCLKNVTNVARNERKLPIEESGIRIRTDYHDNRKQAQPKRKSLEKIEKSTIFPKKTIEMGVQVAEKKGAIVQTEASKQKTKQVGRIINKSQPKDAQILSKTRSSKRLSRNKTLEQFTFNQTAVNDSLSLNSTSKMLPFGHRSQLVQNDLERKIAEQNAKLERLQRQQEEMMIRQFESDRLEPTKIKKKSRQVAPFHPLPESRCSCCSSDSEIMSKLTELGLSGKSLSYKAISSKFLKDRTYKISDNPIYPMSSSSQTSQMNQA